MLGFNRKSYATACLVLLAMILSCSTTTSSSKISITPSKTYDFGDVVFGQSATNDFVFSNKTDVSINITSASITGTNANQFAITVGGSPTSVASNGTHTITVQFTPAGGKAAAALRVNYKDENDANKELVVNLKGASIDSAAISVNVTGTPPTYDFGAVASGQTKSHAFRISNSGNADLEVKNITINNTVFFITAGFTPGNPEIIHKNDYIDVYVQFAPTAVGPVTAIFAITHDAGNVGSPYEIQLKGAGGSKTFETDVTGTPPTIDFGKVYANVSKHRIQFSIWNTGFDPLQISNITFSDPTAFTIFSGWTGTPIDITTNTVDIIVEFTPQAVKSYNETMSINHNGVNVTSPTVFTLLGEGTSNYNAEKFQLGYTPLTSGTFVLLHKNEFKGEPIGFDFNYYGNVYNTIYVSSKGYVGFGPTTDYAFPATNNTLPSPNAPNNIIMLFNMEADPELGATFRYKVEGVAPNRAFVLHIVGLEDTDNQSNGIVSGQIILYETTNNIELCYPTSGITWPNSNYVDVLIGLENIDGTKGVNYNGTDLNPVTSTPSWNIRYK